MDGVTDGRHLMANDEDDVPPVDVSGSDDGEHWHVFGDDVTDAFTEQRTGDEAI